MKEVGGRGTQSCIRYSKLAQRLGVWRLDLAWRLEHGKFARCVHAKAMIRVRHVTAPTCDVEQQVIPRSFQFSQRGSAQDTVGWAFDAAKLLVKIGGANAVVMLPCRLLDTLR